MAPTDSTVADLDELANQARAARRPFEGQWLLNLAYWNGRQWMAYDGSRLYEPALEPWRIKLVDNRIRAGIRTEIAKMTKTRPAFTVPPRTADDEAVWAAWMAEEIVDYLWLPSQLNLAHRLRAALQWSRICSAGFWKIYWDSSIGESCTVLCGEDGKPLYDQSNRPMRPDHPATQQVLSALPDEAKQGLQERTIAMGDVCVDVRSPFEMGADPLAGEEGLDSAEWIYEETVQSMEYVRARYPDKADLITPDAAAQSGVAESRMPGVMGLPSTDGGGYKGVRVREYWSRATADNPKGQRAVWACGQLLYQGENPYADCDGRPILPYVMFSGIPAPGRFWPGCVTDDLISPQTELNKRKAQIAENAARIGNPPLTYPEGLKPDWNGLPGEELPFENDGTPNARPAFLEVPELGSYIREDVNRIEDAIREILGQHEVTSGTVPAGVTAASAINLLQEGDDTKLGPDIEDMELQLAKAGTMILEQVGANYTDERTIRIGGEEGAWAIYDFRGSQLKGHTQVEVQAGSAMPRSKAAQQAAMQSMLNMILQFRPDLADERNLSKFFRDFGVGGLDRFFADMTEDERQVNRENRQLVLGASLPVNSYDNNAYHIAGHEDFQKSGRYDRLVEKDPSVAQRFDAHVAAHREQVVAEAGPPPPGAMPPGTAPPGANGAPANGQPTSGAAALPVQQASPISGAAAGPQPVPPVSQ